MNDHLMHDLDVAADPRQRLQDDDNPAMRAVVQHRYGSAETWEIGDVDVPALGPDEVLVRVHAAGLDRGTWHEMTGRPYLMRAMGFGLRAPKRRIPGRAVAGVVTAVGADVARFVVGDRVFGAARGSFAEYAVASADKLAHAPVTIAPELSAAVPISATAALQGLRQGDIAPGRRVLVIGASGGVGAFAVQLAAVFGAEVTGVCSVGKADLVRSFGAGRVVDYRSGDALDGSRRYDLILDIAGNTPLRRLRRALEPSGSLVIVGGESKGGLTGGLGRSLLAPLLSLVVRQRLSMLVARERPADLEELAGLIDAGLLTPSVETTYPLDRAADAMRHLESGAVRGKVTIAVATAVRDSGS